MNPTQLAIAAMTDEEREEYHQVGDMVGRTWIPIEVKIVAWSVGAVVLLSAAMVPALLAIGGRDDAAIIVCAVIWGAVFLGGLISAGVIGSRSRKRMRLRRAELLAAASSRIPDPRTRRRASDDRDDGTNWSKYPVTGVYDPQTYYERGGRSTARAMQAWGDIDYETYRSNIE